jgi:nucleotide-binding universal stress UspA family protein
MGHESICVAVALQRYVKLTPVALRQRELTMILARHYGAKVGVVTVDAPVALLPDLETTESKLERYVEPLSEAGLEVNSAYRRGKPSTEIKRFAVEVGADLIVIGSHSKRGPLDVGLGSTASALRLLDVPVLMVRQTAAEAAQTKEMMVPHYPFVFPYA